MYYNQFSYRKTSLETALSELQALGFNLSTTKSDKRNLENFLRKTFLGFEDTDYPLDQLVANSKQTALEFFQSEDAFTPETFYVIALQLLGFIPQVDFTDYNSFLQKVGFPITFSNLILNLHQLLATRTKDGNTLIDKLVSEGLLPNDNDYHFFNGKSLATFDTTDLIREVVYVEAPIDTESTGQLDLIKVNISRPKTKHKIPTMMTASPYHQGVNEVANDKKLHEMTSDISVKKPEHIKVDPYNHKVLTTKPSDLPSKDATEHFSYISSYSLNDYFLARGYANIYVSGIGTAASTGFMTSGDYLQVESFKAVIDWLNGRANAYTSHQKDFQVKASWSNGLVCTTGKSYLGTMSTALATTGVDGLKVIIAESAISSWYDYYRENGLVCSPGGYPGEDLDVLTELTYSRNLIPGDYLRHHQSYQERLNQQSNSLDRQTGDYNQFWHDRNYLPHVEKIKCDLIYTHGLQDWNVKPSQVYNIFNALPQHLDKHLFLHHGEHVYMHNWQSIDFKETMNAYLAERMLGQKVSLNLAPVIWQENDKEQHWTSKEQFKEKSYEELSLGSSKEIIKNHYDEFQFKDYAKDFKQFKEDLFNGKTNAICIDIKLEKDYLINGKIKLNLKTKSTTNHGIISAQVLDFGLQKRYNDQPQIKELMSIDNGRNFSRESLKELKYVNSPYRLISKGFLNLQNREDLLTITEVPKNEWFKHEFELQPSLYQLSAGQTLRILIYTTDFEHTIRSNEDYQLTIDLEHSTIHLPQ